MMNQYLSAISSDQHKLNFINSLYLYFFKNVSLQYLFLRSCESLHCSKFAKSLIEIVIKSLTAAALPNFLEVINLISCHYVSL